MTAEGGGEGRGQSRVLTQFKKSEKFGIWQDNCEPEAIIRGTGPFFLNANSDGPHWHAACL